MAIKKHIITNEEYKKLRETSSTDLGLVHRYFNTSYPFNGLEGGKFLYSFINYHQNLNFGTINVDTISAKIVEELDIKHNYFIN